MKRIATALAAMIAASMICAAPARSQGNHPPCRKADSLALVSMYNALDGPNWKSSGDYCPGARCWLQPLTWVRNWFGVEFAGDLDSVVTKVKLGNESLVGTLPDEIGNLEFLTHLELHDNAIGFDLPASISTLWNLEVLNVGGNLITGYPTGIYDLPFLEIVNLADNALGGPLPEGFASMRVLKYLYLNGNNFEGPIPESYLSMSGLRGLFLAGNSLSGEIPSDLSGLTSLQMLTLSDNDLEGDAPSTKYPPDLRVLFLQNNRFTGLLNRMQVPQNLERLYMQGNQLQGWIPRALASLKDVQLHDNRLYGIQRVSPPGAIQNLQVHFNQLTFDGIIAGRSWGTGDFFNYVFEPQNKIQGLAPLRAAALGERVEFHDDAFTGRGEDAEIYVQWLRNGSPIENRTSPTFEFGPVTLDDSGAQFSVNATSPQVPNVTLTSTPSRLVVIESNFKQSGLAIVTWMPDLRALCAPYIDRGLGGLGSRLRKGDVLLPGDVVSFPFKCHDARQHVNVTFGGLGTVSLRRGHGERSTKWLVDELIAAESVITTGKTVLESGILGIADPGGAEGKNSSSVARHSIQTPYARIINRSGVHMSIDTDSLKTTINVASGHAVVAFDTLLTRSKSSYMLADSTIVSAWQTVDVNTNGIQSIADFSISELEISPDTISVSTGTDWTFTAIGSSGTGSQSVVDVIWTTDGGQIDTDGYFVAGTNQGTFTVTAFEPHFGLNSSAVVDIKEGIGVAIEAQRDTEGFRIGPAYPNPFHGSTTIPVFVDRPGPVTLSAYDILGRRVAIILDEDLFVGRRNVTWRGRSSDGAALSSGAYFLVLQTDAGRRTRQLIVIR